MGLNVVDVNVSHSTFTNVFIIVTFFTFVNVFYIFFGTFLTCVLSSL